MGVIAFLKKENESASESEIKKISQYACLDDEGNAQLGLELILENNSEEMDITGIQIVVPAKIIEGRDIVEKSRTLLEKSNPWNTRYSRGYHRIDPQKGEIILDGEECHAIGFKDKNDITVDNSYGKISIIDVDFKKITDKSSDTIPSKGGRGAFRMIIPLKEYAFEIEKTWCCSTFLNHQVALPESFKKYLNADITKIIKIKKEPCDLHVILPPHMVCLSTIPLPSSVAFHSYELFAKSKSKPKREGLTWRARLIMKESEKYLETKAEGETLSYTGMFCHCNYWQPITRDWLTNVIKRETKNALDEYMVEKLSKLFKG